MGLDEFGEPFDVNEDIDIVHYGMPRRSGRYPWGSGENPYQHSRDFISRYEELTKSGMKQKDIAKALDCKNDKGEVSTSVLRARIAIAKAQRYSYDYESAKSMREDGKTYQEIADRLGYPGESSIRSMLNSDPEKRSKSFATAETLKDIVDDKGFINVGAGVEHDLHISDGKLKEAIEILKQSGYEQYNVGLKQLTNPGRQTPLKVLCPPGTTYSDVYKHMKSGDIHSVVDYTVEKNGDLIRDIPETPVSMKSGRISIRYAEDGGIQKDGLIEIRPGVKDLNLGASTYAQVRIGVDGTHYLKGMAIYGNEDDFPDGCDIIFNTNKSKSVSKMDVLKPMKDDADNPFGALLSSRGQSHYIGEDGKEHLSPINKIREEGDWDKWEQGLPHQFLAKQRRALIKQQLDLAYADKRSEYDDICSLTNPVVRKHFLKEFGDQCDSDAVKMKAASLPGQKWKVLIPTTKLNDREVYDPTHKNGEVVALVRFPHAGPFEIPICTVNNKNPDISKQLGNAKDAIAINHNVADRLSGADFDGDAVLVIPIGKNPATQVRSADELVKGFDPKSAYATTKTVDKNGKTVYLGKNGKPVEILSKANTQTEMGKISNLITDMTVRGAPNEELARAVRHSMVIIDAHKHELDYKQSFVDNDIASLKRDYQGRYIQDLNGVVRYTEAASTIFSRAKADVRVGETQGNPYINPKTGAYDWTGESVGRPSKITGRTYIDEKTGKEKPATKTVHQMDIVSDAHELSSGTVKEEIYADYANHLKALANESRKAYISTSYPHQDKQAAKEYHDEVISLKAKLVRAQQNAPRERQAQILAGSRARAKYEANKDIMTKSEYKKLKNQELARARVEVGAYGKASRIDITDREWEAIQHNAISGSMLNDILEHSDPDALRERAMPRQTTELSSAKIAKISAMKASGYTIAEIAKAIGVSSSTVSKNLK